MVFTPKHQFNSHSLLAHELKVNYSLHLTLYELHVASCHVFLCLLSKTETTCDDGPSSNPPKVMKLFNRSLLYDCVSRADANALEGMLEYLQSHEKRLTDEEFRGETNMCRLSHQISVYCLLACLIQPLKSQTTKEQNGFMFVMQMTKNSFS